MYKLYPLINNVFIKAVDVDLRHFLYQELLFTSSSIHIFFNAFYHLKTRKYFVVYYITNEWVVFTTHKTYPKPSSNSLYLTNKGEIIFKETAPYDTFQFNIIKVHSYYRYKEPL